VSDTITLTMRAAPDGPIEGSGDPCEALPAAFADEAAARAWAADCDGEDLLITLVDDRVAGVMLIRSGRSTPLDDEGIRVVRLARHELAVAFRSATQNGDHALTDEREADYVDDHV